MKNYAPQSEDKSDKARTVQFFVIISKFGYWYIKIICGDNVREGQCQQNTKETVEMSEIVSFLLVLWKAVCSLY